MTDTYVPHKPLTEDPCPRCIDAAHKGMRVEAIQRLPQGAFAPLGFDGRKCCDDCSATDNLRPHVFPGPDHDDQDADRAWQATRITVANHRQESMRLPGVPMGLGKMGRARNSVSGELPAHLEWLESNNDFGFYFAQRQAQAMGYGWDVSDPELHEPASIMLDEWAAHPERRPEEPGPSRAGWYSHRITDELVKTWLSQR